MIITANLIQAVNDEETANDEEVTSLYRVLWCSPVQSTAVRHGAHASRNVQYV